MMHCLEAKSFSVRQGQILEESIFVSEVKTVMSTKYIVSDILAVSFKSIQINVNVRGLNYRYLFMMLSKLPICYKKHKPNFF